MAEIVIAALLTLTVAMSYYAARQGTRAKALAVALRHAHDRADWLDTHAGAWEQRATDAEADLEAMRAQRDNVRELYVDFVKRTLGEQRMWVVMWEKGREK